MQKIYVSFVEWLMGVKYWQVITLGAIATLAAGAVVSFAASLGYDLLPDAFGWVLAVHTLGYIAVGWFVPAPFVEAFFLKKDTDALRAAWLRIMDAIDDGHCTEECERAEQGDEPCDEVCEKSDDA